MTTTLGAAQPALLFLAACSVKVTVLFAAAVGAATLFRRASAAFRHQLWTVSTLGAFLLPLLSLLVPAWHSPALGGAARLFYASPAAGANPLQLNLPAMVVKAALSSASFRQWAAWILLVWAIGASFAALQLVRGLVGLKWLAARSTALSERKWRAQIAQLSSSLGSSRPVELLECRDPSAMPVTWGFFHPCILLPARAAAWPQDLQQIVLAHELAHIARRDWLVQIFAELVRALYWFHPLAWVAAARVRQEAERACDDCVLRSGVDPSDYANQLLGLAQRFRNSRRGWSVAVAFARPSNLERRFAALLNPSANRRGLSPRAAFLAKAIALLLLLPLAAIRLPGQDLSGKFGGTVFDVSDAAVPNATIVMTNHKAKTIDMTSSDAQGSFAFKALPAGAYDMQVSKPGFEVYHAPQIVLESGRNLSLNVHLELGSIIETVDVRAEGASQTEAATEAAEKPKAKRLRIGGNVQAAKLLTRVQPVYPEAAKAAGIEGTVVLHAVISMDGKPLSLQVVSSQVDPQLARSAVEAVSQWRYAPTLLNGDPVEIDTTIMVAFELAP